MNFEIPYYQRLKLTEGIDLIPWELIKEASGTDIIHHKDKSTIEAYQFIVNAHGKEINSIFEIGIKNGGSLALWNLIFPYAKITGIDMDLRQVLPSTKEYLKGKGIKAIECNCLEIERVKSMLESVDLFIDDGQHNFETIIPSLENYYPYVSKGGFYVIEDWHSFEQPERMKLLSMVVDYLMDATDKNTPERPYSIYLLKNFIAINKN